MIESHKTACPDFFLNLNFNLNLNYRRLRTPPSHQSTN